MANHKTILIAEDDVALRVALHQKLVGEGFVVFDAKNGEDGLEIALREHPDLVIVDILMPKMDGLTMLNKIRGDNWGKTVNFIIMTNVSDTGELSKAMEIIKVKEDETFEYFVKSDIKLEHVIETIKRKLEVK